MMECEESRPGRRGRKRVAAKAGVCTTDSGSSRRPARRRKVDELAAEEKDDDLGSSNADVMVGSYLEKSSSAGVGRAGRAMLGKVVSYDDAAGTFRIVFEDGKDEDLEPAQAREMLISEDKGFGMKMAVRKRKLDQLAPVSTTPSKRTDGISTEVPNCSQGSSHNSISSLNLSDNADSSRNSCVLGLLAIDGSIQDLQIPQMLHLPPSSGDIAVPEESITYLFSVYNFLRSFSLQLFLSPFRFNDFVAALNCTVQNALFDAVHVSLMHALRRHLEALSSEGSKPALKCLGQYNWNLLDSVTWPCFLVEYLYIMGYMKSMNVEGLRVVVTGVEYYALPVGTKLKVLQILCDDVIDSAELRTELEMREIIEDGNEFNLDARNSPDNGPRRVHPRYSKTSAWKDVGSIENSAEADKLDRPSKALGPSDDIANNTLDGNSDECRLCGMDGTLICCDGCPSAYHNRCIGLNKALLPDGLWFCPECTINKLGPTDSRIGRGMRGAEFFGTDIFGRLFMGTCNYLLVTSPGAESASTYYNQLDVARVLNVIYSQEPHLYACGDICRGISEYWEIPLVDIQSERLETTSKIQINKESVISHVPQSVERVEKPADECNDAAENQVSNISENCSDMKVVLCQKDGFPEARADIISFPLKSEQCTVGGATNRTQDADADAFMLIRSGEQHADGSSTTSLSHHNQSIPVEQLTSVDIRTCITGDKSGVFREGLGSFPWKKKNSTSIPNERNQGRYINGVQAKFMVDKGAAIPASFNPQAYVNQYILGDVAASAAANLAVLACEESKATEAHASANPRKALASSIALQLKAFSRATVHFLWPSHDKKLLEVPRERCGWCLACKGASTTRKGCFLNFAAANAIKGSARSVSGLRPIKHEEGHLRGIATYIANMEDALRGLTVGPFLNMGYTQQWRKQLREASNCRVLKFLLLELEKNIRDVAFSGDWSKKVDDWSSEFSTTLSVMGLTAPNQKCGSGGRRNKKQTVASEHARFSSTAGEGDMQWWRGEKLSRVIFQQGKLPSSSVRKAARQGGYRRIPGINYPEGSELPRRSRSFAWKASVELCRNSSQLALQVRYLDAHLRWRDLVPPDQTLSEAKGADFDASVFRNVDICDKKYAENKILYALSFANQKHLPVRVTKSIIETERTSDGSEKSWFSENYVPLYLIKEFEEGRPKSRCSSVKLIPDHLWIYHRKQLQSRRMDIFLYLFLKGEKPAKCCCVSCQRDAFLRNAVRCSSCQGYCHKDCTIPSTVNMGDDLDIVFTCNLCYRAKSVKLIKSNKEVLNNLLSSPGLDRQKAVPNFIYQAESHQTAPKVEAKSNQIVPTVDKINPPQEMMSVSDSTSEKKAKRRGSVETYGLLWNKKKGSNDSGRDFRLQNIVLKSKDGMDPSRKPICCRCRRPYRSDLMYICCEKCLNWFHADALNLEEAQIFDLIGFKCGKCRRKASPKCPYVDPSYRKPARGPLKEGHAEIKEKAASNCLKLTIRTSNYRKVEPTAIGRPEHAAHALKRNEGTLPESQKLTNLTTTSLQPKVEDAVTIYDPLLQSLEIVEPIEQATESEILQGGFGTMSQGQQKMAVRRPQVQYERTTGTLHAIQDAYSRSTEFSDTLDDPDINVDDACLGMDWYEFCAMEEANSMVSYENGIQWDFAERGQEDRNVEDNDFSEQLHDPESANVGDSEYEPQTYFSFSELLANDDQLDDRYDFPENHSLANGIDFSGTSCQISTHDQSGPYAMGLVDKYVAAANEPAVCDVVCAKCKINQPSPDLKCDICELCIHSHCSPWIESEDISRGQWRCGDCRDWR